MENIFQYVTDIWAWWQTDGIKLAAETVVFLYALEKFLEFVTTITPWKWDDNLGVIVGKLALRVSKFLTKKTIV
jgi:hypothetical protein